MPSLPPIFDPHVHTVPSDLRTIVPRAPPQVEMTSAADAAHKAEQNTMAETAFIKSNIQQNPFLTERSAPLPLKSLRKYHPSCGAALCASAIASPRAVRRLRSAAGNHLRLAQRLY